MIALRQHAQHPAFRVGAMDLMPAAPGIAAWGLMTGVAMVQSGLSTFEALLMSLIVFAGSSQLAATHNAATASVIAPTSSSRTAGVMCSCDHLGA